jgi:hypothetical protein
MRAERCETRTFAGTEGRYLPREQCLYNVDVGTLARFGDARRSSEMVGSALIRTLDSLEDELRRRCAKALVVLTPLALRQQVWSRYGAGRADGLVALDCVTMRQTGLAVDVGPGAKPSREP